MVSVHYTGKLANGSIFDSSVGKVPLVFTIGEGEIIDGFEEGVLSKQPLL
ncbi:FKBP-type peptidyl-prolyl cis-trans isomerase [Desulfocastanea catecholica]